MDVIFQGALGGEGLATEVAVVGNDPREVEQELVLADGGVAAEAALVDGPALQAARHAHHQPAQVSPGSNFLRLPVDGFFHSFF